MNFEDALYQTLYDPAECPTWTANHGRLANMIESHRGPGQEPTMVRLEEATRRHFGLSDAGPIDWSPKCLSTMTLVDGKTTINWQAILAFVLQYLPQLLAILFGGS
jgi:hypothetical protein